MNCAPHTVYFCSSQFTSHSRHLAGLTDLYSSDLAGHNSAGPADMAGYNFALAGPADMAGQSSADLAGHSTAGPAVYVRVTADDSHPEYLIGGFEAAADGAKTVQVTNIEWTTGVMDANLACEVTIKTRVKG